MSQKSSLPQVIQSVSEALMPDTVSRARDDVFLIDSGARAGKGPYFEILPPPPILERVSRANSVAGNFSAPPKRTEPLPVSGSPRTAATEGWEDKVLELAKKHDWKVKDLRPKSGAFWVEATIQSGKTLEQMGFKFHPGRGEWWKK